MKLHIIARNPDLREIGHQRRIHSHRHNAKLRKCVPLIGCSTHLLRRRLSNVARAIRPERSKVLGNNRIISSRIPILPASHCACSRAEIASVIPLSNHCPPSACPSPLHGSFPIWSAAACRRFEVLPATPLRTPTESPKPPRSLVVPP